MYFHQPPPCIVPRKRRCRMGRKRKPYYYVITTEGDLITIHEEDISTRNTFSLLKDRHEEFLSKGSNYVLRRRKEEKEEETSRCRAVLRSDTINDSSSMGNIYNIDFSSIEIDFCTLSVMSNKSNICSGYFPSLIPLDKDICLDQTNLNNFNNESINYDPNIFKGKYIKQIINNHSRYNTEYISNLSNLSQQCFKSYPRSRG